jgi:drug/metabolite transporter (DMT)-like permease
MPSGSNFAMPETARSERNTAVVPLVFPAWILSDPRGCTVEGPLPISEFSRRDPRSTSSVLLCAPFRGPALKKYGLLLVIIGAVLWGTDSLFRRPLSEDLSPVTIVFLEHCILSLLMLPFLRRSGALIRQLDAKAISALVFIAIGGSVAATSIFTYGIKYGNPSVVVLLQKVQPLFALVLARMLLAERPGNWFWPCLIPALIGAYLVSIPDWRAGFAVDPRRPLSILAALGAAFLWGASTVLGRYVLRRVGVLQLTGLRFLTALPVLAALYFFQSSAERSLPVRPASMLLLLSMALLSSLAGLLFYYHGLRLTRASIASVAEMVFPLTAVVLNWAVLGIRLTGSQLAGSVLLVLSITALAYFNARRAWEN